jgi:hypothetical protein
MPAGLLRTALVPLLAAAPHSLDQKSHAAAIGEKSSEENWSETSTTSGFEVTSDVLPSSKYYFCSKA